MWYKYFNLKKLKLIQYFDKYISTDLTYVSHYNYSSYTRKKIISFISTPYDNELYIIDELDYSSMLYISLTNMKIVLHFINNANYICTFCELFINDDLNTIGSVISNRNFSIPFFKNAQKILLCNTKNRIYLLKNNIYENVIYCPITDYVETHNDDRLLTAEENIDIFIYGNLIDTPGYRKQQIDTIIKKSTDLNIIVKSCIFETELNELLEKTKIVLHIPSHPNLHTFPWAKCSELMYKRIFFIIEENEEMYIQKLEI